MPPTLGLAAALAQAHRDRAGDRQSSHEPHLRVESQHRAGLGHVPGKRGVAGTAQTGRAHAGGAAARSGAGQSRRIAADVCIGETRSRPRGFPEPRRARRPHRARSDRSRSFDALSSCRIRFDGCRVGSRARRQQHPGEAGDRADADPPADHAPPRETAGLLHDPAAGASAVPDGHVASPGRRPPAARRESRHGDRAMPGGKPASEKKTVPWYRGRSPGVGPRSTGPPGSPSILLVPA